MPMVCSQGWDGLGRNVIFPVAWLPCCFFGVFFPNQRGGMLPELHMNTLWNSSNWEPWTHHPHLPVFLTGVEEKAKCSTKCWHNTLKFLKLFCQLVWHQPKFCGCSWASGAALGVHLQLSIHQSALPGEKGWSEQSLHAWYYTNNKAILLLFCKGKNYQRIIWNYHEKLVSFPPAAAIKSGWKVNCFH